MKRSIDIIVGCIGLVVLAVCWLPIAIAIKVTSPGPVFYRQVRAGWYGWPFVMYKFRTMHYVPAKAVMAPASSVIGRLGVMAPYEYMAYHKPENDIRVTGIGRWLRKTSLDELPQVINILRGEMSFVGPRPSTPAYLDHFGDNAAEILSVKPGLTGLWQVNGRSRTTLERRIELDLCYVRHHSWLMDLRIILRTPAELITGRGVM